MAAHAHSTPGNLGKKPKAGADRRRLGWRFPTLLDPELAATRPKKSFVADRLVAALLRGMIGAACARQCRDGRGAGTSSDQSDDFEHASLSPYDLEHHAREATMADNGFSVEDRFVPKVAQGGRTAGRAGGKGRVTSADWQLWRPAWAAYWKQSQPLVSWRIRLQPGRPRPAHDGRGRAEIRNDTQQAALRTHLRGHLVGGQAVLDGSAGSADFMQGWNFAPAEEMTLELAEALPGKVEAGAGWVCLGQ